MSVTLYIGNKNYSSWSLRPWLCLKWGGIGFTEKVIELSQPGYGEGKIAEIAAVSPSGRVPALHVDGVAVWDSLAIAEWAHENSKAGPLWPADWKARAQARSAAAEMHSGFAAIRRDLSMNIHRRSKVGNWPQDTRDAIDRVEALWTEMRTRYRAQGPWLAGSRSIADAFFTPLATRFRSYGVELAGVTAQYAETLLADAAFKEWEAASIPNSWDRPGFPVIDGLWAKPA